MFEGVAERGLLLSPQVEGMERIMGDLGQQMVSLAKEKSGQMLSR